MSDLLLNIFTDGGSRGNPGPSACAYVIYDSHQHLIAENGFKLGLGTNNQAEYLGVYYAYQYLIEHPQYLGATINFYLDSQLVVRQLSGQYKIKDLKLIEIFTKIKNFQKNYQAFYFHIPREKNQPADALVNKTLDFF